MAVEIVRHKFTAKDYLMAEAGILGEDDRVELFDGEVIEMPPIGDRHGLTVDRLTNLIAPHLESLNAFVRIQNPLHLSQTSEPQPDVQIVRGRLEHYSRHPRADEVLLVIEVADTSLAYDRQEKVPLYGAAGVQELWIVDLIANHIEVLRNPTEAGYASTSIALLGETISPEALPSLKLEVNKIIA